jgi:hypothetical protein
MLAYMSDLSMMRVKATSKPFLHHEEHEAPEGFKTKETKKLEPQSMFTLKGTKGDS